MEFRNQVPPSLPVTEPVLSTPPIQPSMNDPKQSSTHTPQRSRAWVWLTLTGVLVAGLFGGGFFAYSRGYLAIPFLTPKSDTLFARMVDSISDISSAQYSVRANFEGQPRAQNAKPTFENINLNANLPLGNGLAGLFDPNTALRSIPGDAKVEGGMTISIEGEKTLQEANGQLLIDGTYTGSDTSISIDVELRKVEQNLYANIRKFPSIFFVDVSGIKNKWIKITPDDAIADTTTDLFGDQEVKQATEALKLVTKSALEEKLFTVQQRLPAETIGGVRTEHYAIALHPDKLVTVYQAIRTQRQAKGENVAVFDQAIAQLQQPDSMNLINALAAGSRVEIWIDRSKGFLRQIRWGLTIVPDDNIERLKEKQLYLALTFTLDKVNTKVQVDAPTTTIDYDEATRLVTGISKEAQQFDKQIQRVTQIRSALSFYHQKNSVYPSTLVELQNGLKTLYQKCEESTNTNTTNSSDVSTPSITNTATPFSIESIGSSIGLGTNSFECYQEKLYRNGINTTDVYTEKPYEYSKDAGDYTLGYQLKFASDTDSYEKDSYIDGKNTATSKDSSLEKSTAYEESQKQVELEFSPTNTNTSSYWTSIYPCLTAAPSNTVDTDKDGLTDAQEYNTYYTNPCQVDSDSDTYNDKNEVDGGYNPLGPGKASAAQLEQWAKT